MNKRYPQDYSREELIALVAHHHETSIEYQTKYSDTLEKLKESNKELSKLKRNSTVTP